jgi:sialate O-acetylesterase
MAKPAAAALGAVLQPKANAVIQRSGTTGNVEVSIEATEKGRLFARVKREGGTLSKFDWRTIGQSNGTTASGVIESLPVGGEYAIDFELRNGRGIVLGRASVRGVLVGDLWILGGQSNMDGYGKLVGTEPPSKSVHAFYYDDRWDIAVDPLCWHNEAIDSVHWPTADPVERKKAAQNDRFFRQQGAGLAIAFGKTIFKRTEVPVGLIACSHGGTSMEQWDPGKLELGGGSLYGSTIRRVQAVGGKVAGMLWYQGESDANKDALPLYHKRMVNLVKSVRNDLGSPQMPFIYVQLGPFFTGPELEVYWNGIQADQLALEEELAPALMTTAVDLGVDDAIHISTQGQRRLGKRMAHLAEILAYGRTSLRKGPRPASIRFADKNRTILRVHYSDVNMELIPKREVRGFWAKSEGTSLGILKQEVDPAQPDTVIVQFAEPVPKKTQFWYGIGMNPTVNLTDEADMAAPVFGPVTI